MMKRRSENFTLEEKDVLLGLVAKHQNVLENKKSDQTTTKQKDECWDRVAVEFSNEFPHRRRTGSQLKQCWNNTKKCTKKRAATERRSQFQTGGGATSVQPLSELDQRVVAMVPSQIEPLPNSNNSDARPAESSTALPILSNEAHAEDSSDFSSETVDEEFQSTSKKPCVKKKDLATDEFVQFYRLKIRKLKRKMELQEEEDSLRNKCLEKDLELKKKELEIKDHQLALIKDEVSQKNLSIISEAYETLNEFHIV